MNIENKVPAIRFKGFSREWKCRPFLSNFEKIIDFRGRTPKKLALFPLRVGEYFNSTR